MDNGVDQDGQGQAWVGGADKTSPGKLRPEMVFAGPGKREGVPGSKNMCEHTAGWRNKLV